MRDWKKDLERRQKEIAYLREHDIVYNALVENYIKSSFLESKGKISQEEYVRNFNALVRYENELAHKNHLAVIKMINFTVEDITKMFEDGIFDSKTIDKMMAIKFPKRERKENNNT